MKVLYKRYYFQREIFAIEYEGKYLLVYKRSGLNNPESAGEVLPFNGVLEQMQGFYLPIGWMIKSWLFRGRIQPHNKEVWRYDGVEDFLKKIEDFLKDEKVEVLKENSNDIEEMIKITKEVNKGIKKATKNLELFDWGNF